MTHSFRPPRHLRNAHLQSVLPSLQIRRIWVQRRARALLAASRDVVLDCGGGVRLLGHHAASRTGHGPRVVLLHGWEGSADSVYVLSVAAYLFERGFDVFRLNFRDHGRTHQLNPDLFHSCRLSDVVGALRAVTGTDSRPLALVGYSLGGNFALRVAARAGVEGLALRSVVAVCPVLDPARTLIELERITPLYRRYFVHKWRQSLKAKLAAWPDRYRREELLEGRDLTRMTEHLVIRYTEYPDLRSYLDGYAVVGNVLAGLTVPCHVLLAADDPIIPVDDVDRLARPPALDVRVMEQGGHCGFLESVGGESWADREIHRLLAGQERPSAL